MNETQRLLITETHISAERIGQLRKIIITTNSKDLDLVVSDVKDNSKAIILATQSNQNIRNNKRKQKYLSEFVNNYLSSLNASDIIELTSIIEYYENLFENFTCDMEEDEYVVIDEHYKKPIGQRIERLLKYGSIIPNNRKKSEFMEEMDFFVNRLKNYVENQAKIAGFFLTYLNAGVLLDYIRNDIDNQTSDNGDYSGSYDVSYGTEIKNSYLKSVNFNVSLPELYESEEGFQKTSEMGNHVKFELVFSRSGDEGVNKEEFINFLVEKGYKSDGGVFILGGNDHIQIKLVTYNKVVGANGNERFSLEIYSQAQKNNITSELFLELSMPEISYKTEQLVNDVYRKFGHPKQISKFDMEMLLDEVSSYGDDEDDYENISEHSNAGKIIQGVMLNNKGKETIQNSNYIQNIDFDLILEDSEMKEFNKLVEIFENEAIYKEFGVIIPKGMILYGPAGTGKTLFARKISEKINGEFMIIKHTDIDDMYVGQAEKKIEKKFNEAEKIAEKGKKVILFFDEADSLFPKRGEKENHKEGVISVLLQKMDGIKKDSLDNIFVFFTTNRLKSIDSAVLSRFDVKLEIGLPKKEKRIEHFKLNVELFKNKAKREIFGELDYELLAQKTDGKSGRFIKQMVNNAVWNFAHNKISNNNDGLLSNQDILDCIKIIEKEENQSKGIGFTADIE